MKNRTDSEFYFSLFALFRLFSPDSVETAEWNVPPTLPDIRSKWVFGVHAAACMSEQRRSSKIDRPAATECGGLA